MRKGSGMYEPLKRRAIILLMIAMVAIGSLATAAPPALWISISTFSPYYSPELAQIGTGTPISWKNATGALHSITHDGCTTGERCAFDSGPIGPSGTFTVQNLPPGSYAYHCLYHPIMRGVLVVREPDRPRET